MALGGGQGPAQGPRPEEAAGQPADSPLAELEEALELVRDLEGRGAVPTVSEAKQLLRERYAPAAASKLSKLSKHRNLAGHPVVGLSAAIRGAYEGLGADDGNAIFKDCIEGYTLHALHSQGGHQ